ncbi:MAG: LLM class flavin-dependent oxidoreductase [Pseudomonadota bacterium]
MKTGLMLNADLMQGAKILATAREAESMGFHTLWVPEIFGREPFVMAASVLAATERVRVGTAIANVYVRDAMATKAGAFTLADLYGDRFSLGLGVSNVVGNELRGHSWLPPVDKLEGYLDAFEGWQLQFPATGQPPVYLAAHGPKLIDFARRRTNGAFMYLTTSAYLAEAARELSGKELLVMQPVAVHEDLEEARRLARRTVRIYTDLPNYQRAWRAQGFSEADFKDGPSDALLDALVALGPRSRVQEKLAERKQAGATHMILIPTNLTEARTPDWSRLEGLIS